jgi:hypothetical protein
MNTDQTDFHGFESVLIRLIRVYPCPPDYCDAPRPSCRSNSPWYCNRSRLSP